MAATATITFETRDYQASNGQISVGCEVPLGDSFTYDFYIGVTSPSGQTLKALPTVSPDISGLAEDERDSVEVDIPVDDNSDYLGGTYLFSIRIVQIGGVGTDNTFEVEYLYTPKVYDDSNLTGVLDLDAEMNCLTGVLSAEDNNDYDALGLTFVDRDITITPPSIDSQSEATTTGAALTFSPEYTNAPYQVLMHVEFNWDESTLAVAVGEVGPVSAISRGAYNLYTTINVSCEAGGICGSLPCVQAEMDKAYSMACKAGGYHNLSSTQKDSLSWSVMNLMLAKASYDCGQVAKSLIYVSRAKDGLDCSCGCDDSEPNQPTLYTPPA